MTPTDTERVGRCGSVTGVTWRVSGVGSGGVVLGAANTGRADRLGEKLKRGRSNETIVNRVSLYRVRCFLPLLRGSTKAQMKNV